MSDDMNHGHNGHGVEFEHEDLSTRGVFAFMIGLAITAVIIYFIIDGMYSYLDKRERAQVSTMSPLVTSTDVGARRIEYAPGKGDYVEKTFKENGAPLLEIDERGQLRDFVMKQEEQLNSYGWVDEKAGVAHIPIERAMELMAQRGLPVKPETATNQTGAKTPASPKAATKK
jgi:hypothetical protein